MTTREDRERAALHRFGAVLQWMKSWVMTGRLEDERLGGVATNDELNVLAEAFAAHREAAVAAERERVAKMADADAEQLRGIDPGHFRVAIEALEAHANELRSGR